MSLNITVAGPGALGQAVGGKLALAGHEVTFLGRAGSLRLDEITSQGVRVQGVNDPGHGFVAQARAVADLNGARPADLVLLTTKTYNNEDVFLRLQPVVTDATILLSLQNGVGHVDRLREAFRQGTILGGCCFMGASVSVSGIVKLESLGKVIVGDPEGNHARALELVLGAFQESGIPAVRSEDVQRDLWLKLLWNAGLFPWCAVRESTVGEILDSMWEELVRETMSEVVQVARANGVNVSESDIDAQIEIARGGYSSLTPSLCHDLKAGRLLEADAYGGFLSEQGRLHDIPTPLNDRLWAQLQVRSRLSVPVTVHQWSKKIISGIHQGMRKEQQDAFLVRDAGGTAIAVVSDGHGAFGAAVSKMAVEAFADFLGSIGEPPTETHLREAVRATDQKIIDWLSKELGDDLKLDSGATLEAFVRRGDDVWIVHVGDSGAYHVSRRTGTARKLTEDHYNTDENYVGRRMFRGLGHHWEKAGGLLESTPDIIKLDGFEKGDILELSSDGMKISNEERADIILGKRLRQALEKMIERSLIYGKDDFDCLWSRGKRPNPENYIDNIVGLFIRL